MLFNPVWHGIENQEKCSSLEQPKGNFYKTYSHLSNKREVTLTDFEKSPLNKIVFS